MLVGEASQLELLISKNCGAAKLEQRRHVCGLNSGANAVLIEAFSWFTLNDYAADVSWDLMCFQVVSPMLCMKLSTIEQFNGSSGGDPGWSLSELKIKAGNCTKLIGLHGKVFWKQSYTNWKVNSTNELPHIIHERQASKLLSPFCSKHCRSNSAIDWWAFPINVFNCPWPSCRSPRARS